MSSPSSRCLEPLPCGPLRLLAPPTHPLPTPLRSVSHSCLERLPSLPVLPPCLPTGSPPRLPTASLPPHHFPPHHFPPHHVPPCPPRPPVPLSPCPPPTQDARCQTPLHIACIYGNADVAAALIKLGAMPWAWDELGEGVVEGRVGGGGKEREKREEGSGKVKTFGGRGSRSCGERGGYITSRHP